MVSKLRITSPARAFCHAGWFATLAVLALGCAKKPKVDAPTGPVQGTRVEDVARCEYKGRTDRDVQEASSPGSVVANVRRVYGYIGAGPDRRRVLLCREVDTNFDGLKDVIRTYGDHGEKLTEQADSDYNGKVDTWITFGKSRPAKVEFDKSGDGTPDEIRFYAGGELSRIQRDTNADGKPDVFEIYVGGRLERMGIDGDYDGKVDVWHRDEARAREREEKAAAEAEAAEAKEKEAAEAQAAEDSDDSEGSRESDG